MPLVLNGATSGATTLQATDATTQTITLPANSGTIITTASTFAGTGPAFSAYQSAAQTLTSGVFTKINFDIEEWDTNNNFASNKFTPTVAGYYQFNGAITRNVSNTDMSFQFYKNGSTYKSATTVYTYAGTINSSAFIYLNGSTDYVEIYGYLGTGQALATGPTATYFQGCLVRAA